MVKTCPVLINNGVVTVVKFGDTEVQLPYIGYQASQINIVFENGKYSVAPKDYEEKKVIKEKTEPTTKPVKETTVSKTPETVKKENKKTTQNDRKNRKKKR